MICTLTFKKSFGLETIPVDYVLLFIELGDGLFNLSVNDKLIKIKVDRFGISEKEKFILSLFRHSDERDLRYINEIMTLDFIMDVDLTISESINVERIRNSEVDRLVEPYINDAYIAITRLIDSHRTAKYNLKKETEEWKKGMLLLVPKITEREFQTYLFYKLEYQDKVHVGSFSIAQMRTSSSVDNKLILERMGEIIGVEISLDRKFIVQAWEYLFLEDYHNSIICSATVLELTIINTIRKHYIHDNVATTSRIDKFLDNVSNRLLCTVTLGSLGIGDEDLRGKIASVFDIRNGLIHGKRKKVSKKEAEDAIDCTEKFLKILENL